MYVHPRVDVHSGTPTQYRSHQTPSRHPLSIHKASLKTKNK
ncbi:unnamed protein product [Schistosoma margrebowiei]|uniref:Uncharacterized protein n=1 Tax=Schistosoma margrebowiei TaxID=48269 RepID=A0A183N763_9TREM|nr:unnamed protein product [Schistosoma margrebowiei]